MSHFDHIPIATVVIGRDGVVVDLNELASRLIGWSTEDAFGRPWGDVLRLRDSAGRLVHEEADPFKHARPPLTGSPDRGYVLTRLDGQQVPVSMRAGYLFEGNALVEVVVLLRDAAPERRRELNAYDLIATLAHDLRSPLTSIKGFAATMGQRFDRLDDEQKKHMLRTIDHDAERMNRLLADLLAFSRLEARRLELRLERIDLAALSRDVGEQVQRGTTSHEIVFELAEDAPPLFADRSKIEQVVQNLLENAVKHGNPGPVLLRTGVEQGDLFLRVSDTGPGIEPSTFPFIFSKFFHRRTHARSSGTGLGLYICKGIIEAHDGSIGVETTGPGGTTFAVRLPAAPTA
jgi:PAS domain S-box-containing protein